MFPFFLGLAAGLAVIFNGPSVRRNLAMLALKGSDAAATTGRGLKRLSTQIVQDVEDALAEAKAERDREEEETRNLAELGAQVRQLRADIASLQSKITQDRVN